MSVSITSFGCTQSGEPVKLYTLSGPDCSVSVLDWGATVQAVRVPGRDGTVDVLLGCGTMPDYEAQTAYLGAFVGRVANRIGGGSFDLEGRHYQLCQNDSPRPNTLHGGAIGWNRKVFRLIEAADDRLVLGLTSPDGEEGFDGTVQLTVTYSLVPGGFALEWSGTADRTTPLAPTCHAYWNLAGHGTGPVYDQQLQLFADGYTPISELLIPLGSVEPVEGTPFDFRAAKPIGRDIGADHEQLHIANGFDHNFAVNGPSGTLRKAARAVCAESGVVMELFTTLPGVQLYSGNFVDIDTGKDGMIYKKNDGFALEPQYFPNYLNTPAFEQGILHPGEEQKHRTEWRFSLAK